MAEISILDPRVLPRIVQEYTAPESFLGLSSIVTVESDIQPTWEYDIVVHTRQTLERYNSYNTEAVLLDQLPVANMKGGYAYQRVKKSFNPSTLRLLRRIGEGTANQAAGEERVRVETEDIRLRMMRNEEAAVWKMLQGSWTYKVESGVSYTINYRLPSSHQVDPVVGWGNSGDDPIGDISAIKRQIIRDCGYPIARAYMNNVTITKFYELPEVSGGFMTGAESSSKQGQLSDRQKDSFQNERMIPRFHGIDWIEYDAGYLGGDGTLASGVYTPYIPDNMIIFLANSGGDNPYKFKYGPSVDHAAPPNWTGVFVKTWEEQDPSVRQVLMEVQYMPVLTNPYSLATMDIS